MAKQLKLFRSLTAAREAARDCRRCDLWKRATQTVFGAGPARARIMLVGETPGDKEDQAGEPFVGPAGQLLRRALEEAGVDVRSIYLTNSVKHFKWTERGKRRIHERPNHEEMLACRLWIEEEIRLVKPEILVLLGAVAAASLLGPKVRVTRDRGRPIASELAPLVAVTVHPSSILRAPDEAARKLAWREFVRDLRKLLTGSPPRRTPETI